MDSSSTKATTSVGRATSPLFLIDALRASWMHCLAALVAGAVLGAIGSSFLPRQHEAVALLKIGQIGTISSVGTVQTTYVESPADALDRMRSVAFRRQAIAALGQQAPFAGKEPEDLDPVVNRLQAKLTRGNNLIELSMRAESPEAASAALGTITNVLIGRHNQITDAARDLFSKRIDQTRQGLAALQQADSGAGKAEPALELARISGAERTLTMRQMLVALESAMLPPNTFPTSLTEPLSVSTHPVFPNRLFVLGSGLALGLLAAGIVLAWRASHMKEGTAA